MQFPWETVASYVSHHPRWFEGYSRRAPGSEFLGAVREVLPPSWALRRRGYWMIVDPPDAPMPGQGWKLHVSATAATGAATLRAALPVLHEAGVRFKFLMDELALHEANGKLYPRGSSGKFLTVYPPDENRFREIGTELTRVLAGFRGPHILSDRRFPGSHVVFYRYGGFVSRFRLQPFGVQELLIEEPDGTLVPDLRLPYWQVPAWAGNPFAGNSGRTAGNTPTGGTVASTAPDSTMRLDDGRFEITGAIQFSNRGGIYRGVDTETGADVVLREARPGVEVGPRSVDAIALLRHEFELLTALADTGYFVRPVAFFTEWEHAFLVEEFVEGDHFGRLGISTNPIYDLDLTAARMTDYFERFRGLWRQLAEAVTACHDRGIVLGDLSPTNIIVTPDDRIRIIDLESAFVEGTIAGAGLSTPGVVTRRALRAGCGDRRSDHYALGGLMLCTVFACQQADLIEQAVPRRLLTELADDLALPAALVALITDLYAEDAEPITGAEIVRRIDELPLSWGSAPPLTAPVHPELKKGDALHKQIESVIDGFGDYLLGTADTTREDRLYPCDLLVFESNPLSLAHGAYGTLYALQHVRGAVPSEHLAWALQRPTNQDALPPGLFHGSAGVAWALSALGLPGPATEVLRAAGGHPLLYREPGILTGMAGHGMACLRLWLDTGRAEFLDRATAIADRLAATATVVGGRAFWRRDAGDIPVGYGEGASGVAHFLLSLHGATGAGSALELGRAALEFDLSCGIHSPGGLYSFPAQVAEEDDAQMPVLRHYWDEGTAGILTVALRYHHVTGDPALRTEIDRLLPDVRRKYTTFPQLFHGQAGIGNALLDAYEFLGGTELLGDAQRCAEAVLCTAVARPEGIVFPGEQMVRESADLASGSAGIVLFLDRLHRAAPGARTNPVFVLDELLNPAGER